MLPTRWDPFRELSTFHREIDDFFRRTFGLTRGETEEGIFSPVVNSYLKGETYCIEVEIPGMDKKDLDVSIEGNVLTIRGERKMSHEVKEEKFFHRESRYGSFVRRMTLPEGVNTDKIGASYEQGILKLTLPAEKKAMAGRKIEIGGGEEEKKSH